ncbi:MAG: hypothetical protein JWM76_161 [Pseudonocardiales bacterium]|nr:hypothetical protein [Pseudonocardiales bacterium]
MWKKIAIAAAGSAAVVGVGTAALAAPSITAGSATTGPPANVAPTTTPTTTTPTSTPTGKHAKAALIKKLAGLAHASWVAKNGDKYVTHDAIHGAVTAVSATSLTVKAGDDVSQTYVVTSSTSVKVRTAGTAKGTDGKITDVKTGQNVVVTGTGTSTLTAEHIVTGLKK